MTIDDVLERIPGPHRRSGDGWTARCPAHEDRNPSLSVTVGADDRVLLNCHAGCTPEAIVDAVGLTMRDLMPPRAEPARRIVATYDYHDAGGTVVRQVVRYEPKGFAQRRPDGAGGWAWDTKGAPDVLYRLPQVAAAIADHEPVWIVEGEKDADALVRAGVCATTNPQGAGKWRPEYTDQLRGAEVVIVADDDAPGRSHARAVAADLARVAVDAAIVLPAHGKDAADHLRGGGALADFVPLTVDDLAPPEPNGDRPTAAPATQPDAGLGLESWSTFRDHTPADVAYRIRPVMPVGAVVFLGAGSKKGKTWLAIAAAVCAAAGRPFLGRYPVPEPCHVIYVALEGARANLRARIGCLARGVGIDPDTGALDRLAIVYKPRRIDLRDATSAQDLVATVGDTPPGILILDVLRRAARVRESGDGAGDFAEVLDNLRPLIDAGWTIVILHHFTKWNEATAGRDTGDRMSGSGALFGHADAAIFITAYDRHARRYTVEFIGRDEAQLPDLTVRMFGTGTGQYGGFTYTDTATLTAESDEDAADARIAQIDAGITTWIGDHPGASQRAVLAGVGGHHTDTITRLGVLANEARIVIRPGRGNARLHYLPDDAPRVIPTPGNHPESHAPTGSDSVIPTPKRESQKESVHTVIPDHGRTDPDDAGPPDDEEAFE